MGFRVDLEKKQCITPVARASYVSILEKKQLPNSDKEAYGMMLLFPKDDPDTEKFVAEFRKLAGAVMVGKLGKEKAIKFSKAARFPLRDGDDPAQTASGTAITPIASAVSREPPTLS